jgi:branched-chain amino acid transport system substrate-binding protein
MRPAGLTRRAVIAAGATVALSRSAGAQPALPPVVIGVLSDQTGIGAAVSGPPLIEAVRMAIRDTGKLPYGRDVSVVTASFQLRPDDAVAIATRWFDQGVSVIIDVPGSAAALAVQALARARGRSDMITGSITPRLTGSDCSPLGTTWTVDTTSTTTALVKAVARTGPNTWFLIVPDTVLGQTLQDTAIHAIEQSGGQLLGRSRHPEETTDFSSILAQAKASGAGAIGLCDITQGLTAQLRQFQDGGLFDANRRVVAFLPALTDIHAAGAKAAKGLLLAKPFYWNQNDPARSFATRFVTATGQMPDAAHAAAYVAVRQYLRAVVVTEGLDADLINQEMRRTPIYFFGRLTHLRIDGRLAADLSLLRVKPPEAMQNDWDHFEQLDIVPAADVYPPLNQTGCKLAL